jgi:hypothetical protein
VVSLVRGEVLAQSVDALRQQGDLNFGRSRVVRAPLELADDIRLFFSSKWH